MIGWDKTWNVENTSFYLSTSVNFHSASSSSISDFCLPVHHIFGQINDGNIFKWQKNHRKVHGQSKTVTKFNQQTEQWLQCKENLCLNTSSNYELPEYDTRSWNNEGVRKRGSMMKILTARADANSGRLFHTYPKRRVRVPRLFHLLYLRCSRTDF